MINMDCQDDFASALPARGASSPQPCCIQASLLFASALPARGASRGHHVVHLHHLLCLGAACTGCIDLDMTQFGFDGDFASALPARGASCAWAWAFRHGRLCLGAACTGCIGKSRQIAAHHFVAYAVSR